MGHLTPSLPYLGCYFPLTENSMCLEKQSSNLALHSELYLINPDLTRQFPIKSNFKELGLCYEDLLETLHRPRAIS